MDSQGSREPLLESHTLAGSSRKRRHSVQGNAYTRSSSAVKWKKKLRMMEVPASTKRFKKTHTAVIFVCIFALGLVSAVFGGTVPDLKEIFHLDSKGLNQVIVSRSAGVLFGSLLCGNYLYERVNAKIVMILALIFGGLGAAILPAVAPYYWVGHIGFFVLGFSIGALEVGCNVWLVELWEEKVNPMLQSYHVSFGVGALLAPVITSPFMSHQANATMNATLNDQGVKMYDLQVDPAGSSTATHSSQIAIPYALFGGFYSFMGLVILFFYFIDRTELRQHRSPVANDESSASTIRFEWTVVALLSAYIIITVTFETTMANILADYVTSFSELGIGKSESSYLLATYWATYTTGRIATIFISMRIKPNTILVFFQGITGIGTGILFLLVFPAFVGKATVWSATAVIAFGIASLYPTGFTWAVRYIHLKYSHMSFILVASCTGGMLPTYLVAPYIESSTTALPWVCMCCAVLLICILSVMLFTTKNRVPIFEQDDERNLIVHVRVDKGDRNGTFYEKGEQ